MSGSEQLRRFDPLRKLVHLAFEHSDRGGKFSALGQDLSIPSPVGRGIVENAEALDDRLQGRIGVGHFHEYRVSEAFAGKRYVATLANARELCHIAYGKCVIHDTS